MDALICCIGDSLTYGGTHFPYRPLGVPTSFLSPTNNIYGASVPIGYPSSCRIEWRLAHESASGTTVCANFGIPGTKLSDVTGAWLSGIDGMLANKRASRRHILYVAFGTNQGPTPAATFIASMETFVAARKAAGWDDVILQTIPSRTDATWGAAGTQNTAYAKPINDQYLDPAWQTTHGVTISDIAQHAEIGPWDRVLNVVALPSNNATYFHDTVHPTLAAVEIARPTIRAAINARLTAAGATLLPDVA